MNIFSVCMCWWLVASSIKTYCQETPHNNITSHQTVAQSGDTVLGHWETENPLPDICSSAIADQNFVMKLICMNLKSYKYSETLIIFGKQEKLSRKVWCSGGWRVECCWMVVPIHSVFTICLFVLFIPSVKWRTEADIRSLSNIHNLGSGIWAAYSRSIEYLNQFISPWWGEKQHLIFTTACQNVTNGL